MLRGTIMLTLVVYIIVWYWTCRSTRTMARRAAALCLLLLALAHEGEAARHLTEDITEGDASVNNTQSSRMALAVDAASVTIIQEIGDTPVRVMCSGDGQDLGAHLLIKHLQQFGWGFTPKKFDTTEYQCLFSWITKSRSFVVWRNNVEVPIPCVHCVYHLRSNGFYRNEQGGPLVFVTGWL
jgi:hypothetical protein